MKKMTLKEIEKFNEEYGANCTLFEIEVITYKTYGDHLVITEEHGLFAQENNYKEALEMYSRAKWSHGALCEVAHKRAYWDSRLHDVCYTVVHEYTSPRLKKLYDLGYCVLY